MKSTGKSLALAAIVVLLAAVSSFAAAHSGALRMENRLNWALSSRWDLQGGIQARLHDSLSEFYYRKLDAGICYKVSHPLRLPFTVRVEDRIRDFGWMRSTFLLFDPTVILAEPGNWRFDIRARLQFLTDEASLQYLRFQPRLWRTIDISGYLLGCWVYNDIYVRLAEVGTGDVTNYHANNFCTGFNFPLGGDSDLNVYYMLFTGRATRDSERRNAHQFCLSLGFRLGSNGHHLPPYVTN
jgi:hypothetical protein